MHSISRDIGIGISRGFHVEALDLKAIPKSVLDDGGPLLSG